MTIKYLAGSIITGLSSDTKPTTASDGSIFIETDTGSRFIINSGTWTSIVGGNLDGLTDVDLTTVAPSNTNVLSYTTTGNKWVPATAGSGTVTASSTDTFTNKTIDSLTNTIKNVGPATYEMWVESGPIYKAHKISTGVITSNTNFKTLLQAVIDDIARTDINAAARGGRIFLREGEYVTDGVVNVGRSHATDRLLHVVIDGAGHSATKIKHTTNATHMFAPYCNTTFRGIHFDGNAIADQLISCGEIIYVNLLNCRFSRAMEITVWFGGMTSSAGGLKGFMVDHCWWDDPRAVQDQFAFTCEEYGILTNCQFDRTRRGGVYPSAYLQGSSVTSGGGNNVAIIGNSIQRDPTGDGTTDENNGNAISLEAFGNNYNRVTIQGNNIVKGPILIGDNVASEQFRNIIVSGNNLYGNKIRINGRTDGGDYSMNQKNIQVVNNNIDQAFNAGIVIEKCVGPVSVTGNTVYDTNRSGSSNSGDANGCINLTSSSLVTCTDNNLVMTDTGTNRSPYAIRVDACTNSLVESNKIHNPAGHSTIISGGTLTGTEILENRGYQDSLFFVKDNIDVPRVFLNSGAETAPNQHFHFLPDYDRQNAGTTTDVSFFFGYNSDITSFAWWSKWFSNKEYFKVDVANNLTKFHTPIFIGDNYRLKLNETGLTAEREFLFPDLAGTVTTTNATQTITNKTVVASDNSFSGFAQNPLNKRWGTVQPGYGTAVGTVGVMDGLCQQFTATAGGTNSVGFDTTEGKTIAYQTANSSGVVAGLLSNAAGGGLGRRLFGGRMVCRFKLDSTTSARFYFGLTSATTLPISDTPLASGDHGIIVGFAAADTNYQVRHNDGATVTTDQLVGPGAAAVAKTASTAFHTIEINWTASGNYNVIYDGTTHTISTDLPATTADLYPNLMVQTSAAVQRTFTLRGLYIEADK